MVLRRKRKQSGLNLSAGTIQAMTLVPEFFKCGLRRAYTYPCPVRKAATRLEGEAFQAIATTALLSSTKKDSHSFSVCIGCLPA